MAGEFIVRVLTINCSNRNKRSNTRKMPAKKVDSNPSTPAQAKKQSKATKKSGSAKKSSSGRKHKPKRSWSLYIYRTLKQVTKEVGMSGKAMRIMNSFCDDIFERLAVEAAGLARINKTKTLTSREVQTAVRLVLPAELAKHAMAEGAKAVAKRSAQ